MHRAVKIIVIDFEALSVMPTRAPDSVHRPIIFFAPPYRGGALSDTAIRPSVCPSLGSRHAGCLQLAGHQRYAVYGPVR